jgi:hypothetical protein
MPEFQREREYIEAAMGKAPKEPANRWLSGLLATDDDGFVATWFEVVLFGWLLDLGPVEVEPEVTGGRPDFKIELGSQTVFIEAQAHLRTTAERKEDRFISQIFSLISTLKYPYMLDVKHLEIGGPLSSQRFVNAVEQWLSTDPKRFLLYEDKAGNRIGLEAEDSPSPVARTYAARSVGGAVDITPLKKPLHKKATKYKETRHDYPYVIALYLESPYYSARDVAAAWFGREQVIIDRDKLEVIETRVDRTGLHFFFGQIRHTTVAGTMVFRQDHSPELGRCHLTCSYIQNPFSPLTIDLTRLPLQRRLLVTSRSDTSAEMRWT